jgi:hypothetical protein
MTIKDNDFEVRVKIAEGISQNVNSSNFVSSELNKYMSKRVKHHLKATTHSSLHNTIDTPEGYPKS